MKNFQLNKDVYIAAFIYFIATAVVKWLFHPQLLSIVLYALGALVGLHLLEVEERVFGGDSSPFRTVLAQFVLTVMTFFVITSTNSYIGAGLVLFLNLRYLHLEYSQWQKNKSLASWFQVISIPLTKQNEKTYLYVFLGIFTLESILFLII